MKTDRFNYHLPASFIAQTPIEPRHQSKLMVYDRTKGRIFHKTFLDIKQYLRKGDVLAINETKVLPARIFGKKETGGKVEVLLLKKLSQFRWEALVGGKRLQAGKWIIFSECMTAIIESDLEKGKRILCFSEEVEPFIKRNGSMPLPPYIHHPLERNERYQTVYAETEGSAAAPTAGLHFTNQLLDEIKMMGVQITHLTLHVGLDTFAPVDEENIADHHIHKEWCQITQSEIDKINHARNNGKRIIAVGTTSVRTLETAFLYKEGDTLKPFACSTSLFITPGYSFKIVDAMITNFHLPKSTLLMLVSAFAGLENIKRCYSIAMEASYRFYSFGDAMLII